MPVNAPPEFYKAQEKYLKAKTREEKIGALEEMIRTLPKHKGTENLLAQLKAKLSKLKRFEERVGKKKGKGGIRKEGDVMVSIIGFTNSGKTRFLNMLTGTDFKESTQPYSTTEPLTAVADFGGAKIQLVEIPAFFRKQDMSIAHASDCVVLIAHSEKEIEDLEKILKEFRIEKPVIKFLWERETKQRELILEEIWKACGMIRVYTKERNKQPEKKPIVVKKGSTVKDIAERIHKDFVKHFKFAKIWGKSAKFPGEKVGLEHKLEDGDIVEIRLT